MILLFLASLASEPAVACSNELTEAALVCRAIDASKAGDHAGAAKAFEVLAANSKSEVERAKAFAAAGNLWIAAGEAGKAALALDRALVGVALQADQRGNALLDRARAAEVQGDLRTARARLTEAAESLSEDPFYWYFSAALAIREEDKQVAQSAINRALALAPSDPAILFEAGHVAHFQGDEAKARDYWTRAAAADPSGPGGKAARDALALLASPPTSAPAKTDGR